MAEIIEKEIVEGENIFTLAYEGIMCFYMGEDNAMKVSIMLNEDKPSKELNIFMIVSEGEIPKKIPYAYVSTVKDKKIYHFFQKIEKSKIIGPNLFPVKPNNNGGN